MQQYFRSMNLPASRSRSDFILGKQNKMYPSEDLARFRKEQFRFDASNASLGAIVGYSAPFWYPKRFDQTLRFAVGFGQRQASWLGADLRRQVSLGCSTRLGNPVGSLLDCDNYDWLLTELLLKKLQRTTTL